MSGASVVKPVQIAAMALMAMLLLLGCAGPADNGRNQTAGSLVPVPKNITPANPPAPTNQNQASNAPSGSPDTSSWVESNDTNLWLFDRFPYEWRSGPNDTGRLRARQGPSNAGNVLIEFVDYQCPQCGLARNLTAKILGLHPGLALEWRHFPLPQMAYSRQAALGAECAADQGKFWEYSDAVMDDRQNLVFDKLYRLANQSGVGNLTLWAICTKSQWHSGILDADFNESKKWNVSATPTFVLNGKAMEYDGVPVHLLDFVASNLN